MNRRSFLKICGVGIAVPCLPAAQGGIHVPATEPIWDLFLSRHAAMLRRHAESLEPAFFETGAIFSPLSSDHYMLAPLRHARDNTTYRAKDGTWKKAFST